MKISVSQRVVLVCATALMVNIMLDMNSFSSASQEYCYFVGIFIATGFMFIAVSPKNVGVK